MALATFAPSIAPSPGTAHKPRVSLNKAEFGDGYTVASPRGLNHIKHTVALRWEGLTENQALELRTFFEGQGGYRPFYFQPRGFATPTKWTCSDWSFSDAAPWRFEAQLEESFTTET
jgi:phage-related protein